MPGWIGLPELAILLVVILLVFGPKRLPEMGKSLGKGMREFKDGITGHADKDEVVAHHELPSPSPVVTTTAVEEPVGATRKPDTTS